MNFKSISEITETSSDTEANELLEKGWILLGLSRGTSSAGDGDRPYFLYSLGRLCPCPAQWKAGADAVGAEALAEDLGLTLNSLRLLFRGDLNPTEGMILKLQEICDKSGLPRLT